MNKIIGLVVATEREFKTIFKNLKDDEFAQIENFPFVVYSVNIHGKKIYTIQCGMGETLAAAAAQHLIDKYNVNLLLNYGVVGALVENLSITNTIIIDKIIDYQFDVTTIDHCLIGEHLNIKKGQYYETDRGLIELAKKADPTLKTVICASGNKFIDKIEDKEFLNKEYGAEICEMESFGILLIAYVNKIHALFVKGVSDAKTGDSAQFDQMIITSSEITFKLLTNIIKELN